MAWNNLTSPNLRLGQVVTVSGPAGTSAASLSPAAPAAADAAGITRHTVAPGESLYRISKQYGVSVQQLMTWNGLPDFNVKLGQQLIVGKK